MFSLDYGKMGFSGSGSSSSGAFAPPFVSFSFCEEETLDFNGLDTSNIRDMGGMFLSCENLTSLDLSSFNTSNVTNMNQMFNECTSLASINLSSFNTSQVTNMSYMFGKCTSLTSIDLSNFDISKVNSTASMFNKCTSLQKIILNFNKVLKMTNVNMLTDCPANIYVPDDVVEIYKSSTNWSAYADRIKPVSELGG